MKKVLLSLFVILLSIVVVGCKTKIDSDTPTQAKEPKITMKSTDQRLKVGETFQLEIEVENYDGEITWFSSDKKVVTIKDGTATVEGEGTSQVGASFVVNEKNTKNQ